MNTSVDVVVLTRDERPIRGEVLSALAAQKRVAIRLHRVIGTPQEKDATRHVTIARARNRALECGISPWVMFVDDDIVLPGDAVVRLFNELRIRPAYAALGANVLGDCNRWNLSGHVGMGATLFRRSALAQIRFRAEPGTCECALCCQDLRRRGWAIAYLQGLWARHLPKEQTMPASHASADGRATLLLGRAKLLLSREVGTRINSAAQRELRPPTPSSPPEPSGQPHILVAFNRRHFDRFRDQFLRTLRAHGNDEPVSVVGYGLYPSEQRTLSLLPGVHVHNYPVNGVLPPIRRLLDFQTIVRTLPANAPVAYWDAGDVLFQSSLTKLWQTVAAHRDRLLAVREPKSYPHNAAVIAWSQSITDLSWRKRVLALMKRSPFLNSGFAAGTAASILRYLEAAHRMRHGVELSGSSDWGDQMALNVYCHTQPDLWQEIETGWNYCLHDQPRGEMIIRPDGVLISRQGAPIYVVHGNARSLRKFAILR